MHKNFNKNIKTSYIFNFLMNFDITSGIWVLYMGFKGLSLTQIGLVEAIFHITGIVFEIPTGALADLLGRRTSIILGRICAIISTLLMINSNSFAGFAIAFIFSGLSYNLNSGANDALLYDTLKLLKLEENYIKIYGFVSFLMDFARAAAVILGGVLSDITFLYAYLLMLIVNTLALIAALFYVEPPKFEKQAEKAVSFFAQLKESIVILKTRKLVFYLITFFALASCINTIIYFYSQKYFENMMYSKTIITLIISLSCLLSAFGSKYAHSIEKIIKRQGFIILFPAVTVSALLGMAFFKGYISIGLFLITSALQGIGYPIFSNYINSLIPSEYRATLLSFDSLSFSICMVTLFPLVGFIGDEIGLNTSFIVTAILFIPVIIYIYFKIKKHRIDFQEGENYDSISAK